MDPDPDPAPGNTPPQGASDTTPDTGWTPLFRGGNGLRALTLAGGVVLHATNLFMATTILPSVVGDIGGLELYAWNTTLFVVASILGSALSVKLLGGLGPRNAYAVAALVFAAGGTLCALAPTMTAMLAGRLVQGLGGGFLLALAYAMVRSTFAEPLWPRAMALISGMWGVATVIGPAIGGVFAQVGAWRWAYGCTASAALVFALLAFVALPAQRGDTAASDTRLPLLQLVLLTLAVLAISAGSARADPWLNAAGLGLAALFTAALIRREKRPGLRLLPTGTFAITGPLGSLYAMIALLSVMVTAGEIFGPLFLQRLHGQSPLAAGFLTAAVAAGWTLGAMVSAGASPRQADRALVAAPLLAFAGMAVLAWLLPHGSGADPLVATVIAGALGAVGLGVGLTWPHLLTRVLRQVPDPEQALASSSLTTVQLFAESFGAATAGMIVNLAGLADPGDTPSIARAAAWLFALFAATPLLAALLGHRRREAMQGE